MSDQSVTLNSKDEIFAFATRLKEYFDKGGKPIIFERKLVSEVEIKTNSQLAWLHKIIADYLVDTLFETGCIEAKSPHLAKFWLKEYIGYGDDVRFKHKGVECLRFVEKSFAKASKQVMNEAIDAVARVCAFNGVVVPEADKELKA